MRSITGRDLLEKSSSPLETLARSLINLFVLWNLDRLLYRYLRKKKKKKKKSKRENWVWKKKKKKKRYIILALASDKRDTQRDSSTKSAQPAILRDATRRHKSSHTSRSPTTVMNDSMKRQCSIYVQCFSIYIIIIVTITVGGPTSKQANVHPFTHRHTRLITNRLFSLFRDSRHNQRKEKKKKKNKNKIIIRSRDEFFERAHAFLLFFFFFRSVFNAH